MRYGPPQRPPKEKKMPKKKKNHTASGQKAGVVKPRRTPSMRPMTSCPSAVFSLFETLFPDSGRSWTKRHIKIAKSRVNPPTAIKENRHPLVALNNARGGAALR